MFEKSRLINIFLFFLCFFLFLNLARSYIVFKSRRERVNNAQLNMQKIIEENENLERQLARVESKQYIEEEARNKLNMGKDGETVLILPSIEPVRFPTPTPSITSSNPEKWFKIFF